MRSLEEIAHSCKAMVVEENKDPSAITEFDEVIIDVTPVTTAPTSPTRHAQLNEKADPNPLGPLYALLGRRRRTTSLVRVFKVVRGWQVRVDPATLHTVFRGRMIPVDQVDDLLLRINSSRIHSLRVHFTPYLPSFPSRLFSTLYLPTLRSLHFDQPLRAADQDALACFLASPASRRLERLCLDHRRIGTGGGVSVNVILDALLEAHVSLIDYRFEPGTQLVEIDLNPLTGGGRDSNGRPEHRRRKSNGLIRLPTRDEPTRRVTA